MTELNTQILLAQRPEGMPQDDTWSIKQEPIVEPAENQFLVQVQYVSLDPAMRGWLRDARSYIPPVQVDEVMRAVAVGEVMTSNHPKFPVGAKVQGIFGVQ